LKAKKEEDASFASITKHQKHPPRTMAKLKESDQLPAEARRYKDRIEHDSARLPGTQCANCESRHFHRHQQRLRWFLSVIERIVWPIRCLLVRWCCVNCGATFTHLSPLCVPFKRYLRSEIATRAGTYVETDPMSYRQVVKERGSAVVYNDPIANAESTEAEKEKEATPELRPSTVHRWIGAIAACREQWQPAVRLARQVHQEARLSSLMISASKYRSPARKGVLETCGLLLRALKIVTERNPTQLETRGSSP
jgi:hypothetical protein